MSDRLNEHFETQTPPVQEAYVPILGEPMFHEDIQQWIAEDQYKNAHIVHPPLNSQIPQQMGIPGVGDAQVEMKISWSAPYRDVIRFTNQPDQYASQAPAPTYYSPEAYPVQDPPYYEQPDQPVVTEYTDTQAQAVPIITSELPFIQAEQQAQTLTEVMQEHAVTPPEAVDDNKNKKGLTFRKVRNIGAVALVVIASGPLYQAASAGPSAAAVCAENGLASVWADPLCPITSFFGELINPGNILNYVVEKP